jgi:tetratricopeptide (TPR) repeat protein
MHCLTSILLIGFLLSGSNLILESDITLSQHAKLHLTRLSIHAGQPDAARMLLGTLNEERFSAGDNATILHTERARLYALLYDYDAALNDVNAAIEIADRQQASAEQLAAFYTHRGEIYLLRYEWDAALTDFNRALELSPDYADAHFQRGVLYYTMAQRDNALDDFRQYRQLAPDGTYSDQVATYIESIQAEIEALNPRRN